MNLADHTSTVKQGGPLVGCVRSIPIITRSPVRTVVMLHLLRELLVKLAISYGMDRLIGSVAVVSARAAHDFFVCERWSPWSVLPPLFLVPSLPGLSGGGHQIDAWSFLCVCDHDCNSCCICRRPRPRGGHQFQLYDYTCGLRGRSLHLWQNHWRTS